MIWKWIAEIKTLFKDIIPFLFRKMFCKDVWVNSHGFAECKGQHSCEWWCCPKIKRREP